MTEEQANDYANEIVNELVVFDKIKMNVKNVWAEKLIQRFIEKPGYNPRLHSQVLEKIEHLVIETGIGCLLDLIDRLSIKPRPVLEDKASEVPYALLWNGCKTTIERLDFLEKTFSKQHCPPSTKYVIREWMQSRGVGNVEIKAMLGGSW